MSTRKVTNASGITTIYGPVSVDHVKEHKYKDQFDSAQLRMEVTTEYPSARPNDGGFFQVEDYDLESGKTYTSTRIAWLDVPKNFTAEQMVAKITDKTILQRRISNDVMDVLSTNQKAAITAGLRTKEEFEAQFLVCDRDGNALPGKPQYSQNFASAVWVEDVDMRTEKTSTANTTVAAEVNAAVGAQEVI